VRINTQSRNVIATTLHNYHIAMNVRLSTMVTLYDG